MSKEKFVRNKPHVNFSLVLGLFIAVFVIAAGLTYFYPDLILPASQLLYNGTSSLRNQSVHIARILTNGLVYGLLVGVTTSIILKGKKILQN
ncbi:MAG: hypothetical protein ACW987_16915 [Candidatus Thorarchaeota archaeon]|jgi:membrane-anchored glycerophosphoryl diester phosphodiesterase (GDPDase)